MVHSPSQKGNFEDKRKLGEKAIKGLKFGGGGVNELASAAYIHT